MSKLVEKIKALFKEGVIELAIGFEEGSHGVRPLFCKDIDGADKLILDERCTNNLAVYLTKPELLGTGKVALTANLSVLRSVLQLSSENQLDKEKFVILTVDSKGEVVQFESWEEINTYLTDNPLSLNEEDLQLIAKIQAMPREERWKFWINEMSKCVKCYACRAACPLCYCNRCIVEVNRPQWIQAWSAPLTNMEWQINRVMHMAGRCIGCGACKRACPVGIPLHLLSLSMMEDIREVFGKAPGSIDGKGNVLSTFKVDDKENFIH